MGADVLATQGTGVSATMILTMLKRIDYASARQGLIYNPHRIPIRNYTEIL